MQKGREDLPARFQLLLADRFGVIALEGVEQQGLIGLGDIGILDRLLIGEIELGFHGAESEAWLFGVHL